MDGLLPEFNEVLEVWGKPIGWESWRFVLTYALQLLEQVLGLREREFTDR